MVVLSRQLAFRQAVSSFGTCRPITHGIYVDVQYLIAIALAVAFRSFSGCRFSFILA